MLMRRRRIILKTISVRNAALAKSMSISTAIAMGIFTGVIHFDAGQSL